MEHEVKLYRKYKRDLRFLLLCSGLWPDFQAYPAWFRNVLSFCSAFTCGGTTCGIIAFCVHHIATIAVLTRGLSLMISYGTSCIKVCVLAKHMADMSKLHRSLSARFEEDLEKPENREHLLAHFRTFSRFFYTFDYSVALIISLIVIAPVLALRHGKYIRMYPTLIPFSYEPGGTVHWCIFVFEVMTGYYCWSVTVGVDSVFGYYTLHMVGELRLLAARFRELRGGPDYRSKLRECVDRHVLLLQSQHIMQRLFGFLSIWLAVTCAVVLCAIIFQATETKNMTAYRAIYLICYCFLKLVQAYSYAWFGHIITLESEMCLDAIYHSHWPGSNDLRFMNDILIVQSQIPMDFQAMGCMIVQLDMFSKIVHGSVSYFFLLQTLEEGSNSAVEST